MARPMPLAAPVTTATCPALSSIQVLPSGGPSRICCGSS
jgi:hypothetical protein